MKPLNQSVPGKFSMNLGSVNPRFVKIYLTICLMSIGFKGNPQLAQSCRISDIIPSSFASRAGGLECGKLFSGSPHGHFILFHCRHCPLKEYFVTIFLSPESSFNFNQFSMFYKHVYLYVLTLYVTERSALDHDYTEHFH